MANINVTGKFDEATERMMNRSRCGIPDITREMGDINEMAGIFEDDHPGHISRCVLASLKADLFVRPCRVSKHVASVQLIDINIYNCR